MKKNSNNTFKKRKKDNDFIRPCDCVGGKKYCGELRVLNYGDGDLEICIKEPKKKVIGIYWNEESVKELKKYLDKLK